MAAENWPGIATYSRVGDMVRHADLDLVAIITPHNTHAKLALQCLNAGVSVVTEKPMAVTTREIAMIAMAKRRKVMLSTFHNRRWDGDFMGLRDLIRKEKLIGRVFKIEAFMGNYRKQGDWWRSDRKISGGAIYDWGAHFMDWILNIINDDMDWVSGYQVKNREWRKAYTNEDHSEVTVRFKSGCMSHIEITNLAMSRRPKWRILGERGSIVAGDGVFEVQSLVNGREMSASVPYGKQDYHAYYANVYRHLQGRAKLAVTAESAARVIAVLEAANKSAAKGSVPIKPAYK